MKGILDFDDTVEVKHPESVTTAICYDDLRLDLPGHSIIRSLTGLMQ